MLDITNYNTILDLTPADRQRLWQEQQSLLASFLNRSELESVRILCLGSEETVNLFLPLALLLARTFLPLAVAMRSLKPCLFLLFLLDG